MREPFKVELLRQWEVVTLQDEYGREVYELQEAIVAADARYSNGWVFVFREGESAENSRIFEGENT